MKKLIVILIFAVAYPNFVVPANAQTKLESTLEGVKGQVENLVTAKDEKSVSELALRIETFKKVIEFSVSEAKDLKVKLLGLDDLSEEEVVWREAAVKKLNGALDYYEEQKLAIEDTTKIDLDKIKTIAAEFKNWRDFTYLPDAERANEFILIRQERKAVSVAERRWERINEDVVKLEKAKIKGAEKLRALLDNANELINEGKTLNAEAESAFSRNYILTSTSTATSTATSAASSTASSTLPEEIPAANTTSSTSTATSTKESASEESALLITQPPSIKGLVEDSLSKIRDAYQVFIEMSNLVRELLK